MSLLSPESLSAFVAPDGIIAVCRRGWGGRIAEKRAYPATAGAAAPGDGIAAAFGAALQDFACRRVRVVLSSHLVHYQLQPWRSDIQDAEEELALARLAFTETYGPIAETWRTRLSDEPPGQARVAAAVAPELLDALTGAARRAKARISSIQPYLVAGVNAWRRHFGRDRAAWLVLHEEGRLSLALIEGGRWRWVRSVRAGDDWRERLPELVDSEILLAGVESLPAEVLVFAPAYPDLAVRAGTRLPFRSLRLDPRDGYSPVGDGAFGLALVG